MSVPRDRGFLVRWRLLVFVAFGGEGRLGRGSFGHRGWIHRRLGRPLWIHRRLGIPPFLCWMCVSLCFVGALQFCS